MKTLALATLLLATTCAQATSDADTPPVSDDSPATQIATDKQYLQLDNQTDRLTFYISDGYLELRQPDGEKIDPEQPDEDFRLERQ